MRCQLSRPACSWVLGSSLLFVSLCATPATAQTGAAVLNHAGFPVKGITKRPTSLFVDADPGSSSRPYEQFKFVYILPPDKDASSRRIDDLESLTSNGFYRVARGDSESELLGWIREEDVEEWHHIQALAFTKKSGRDAAVFFDANAEAEQFLIDGDPGPAAYREPASYGGNLILMPLFDAGTITVDDEEQELYQVSFLAGPAGGGGLGGDDISAPEITYEQAVSSASLDLVFVIDTTASMSEPISQVLRSVSEVSRLLSNRKDLPKLRLGLVGYRDPSDDPAMEYVVRVFCDLEQGENLDFFLRQIRRMDVSPIGSGEWQEDVWAGLSRALDSDAMKWNEAPSAWKIITLIGDASAHELGHPKNTTGHSASTVMKLAQPDVRMEAAGNPVAIVAQHILNDDAGDDRDLFLEQFLPLTEEATWQGNYLSSQIGEDFSEAMTKKVLARLNLLDDILADPSAATPAASVSAADVPSYVIERLKEIQADDETRGAARKLSFSKAYASEFNPQGVRQFNPYIFVSKTRLKTFRSILDLLVTALEGAGEPGAKNVQDIMSQMRIVSATLQMGQDVTAEMPIDQLLNAVLGFPVQTNIFSTSIQDLAQMGQSDWERWVSDAREVVRTMETLLSNPSIWWALDDGATQDHHHAFIKLSDLP